MFVQIYFQSNHTNSCLPSRWQRWSHLMLCLPGWQTLSRSRSPWILMSSQSVSDENKQMSHVSFSTTLYMYTIPIGKMLIDTILRYMYVMILSNVNNQIWPWQFSKITKNTANRYFYIFIGLEVVGQKRHCTKVWNAPLLQGSWVKQSAQAPSDFNSISASQWENFVMYF